MALRRRIAQLPSMQVLLLDLARLRPMRWTQGLAGRLGHCCHSPITDTSLVKEETEGQLSLELLVELRLDLLGDHL